jgi:hypothetical protein
LYDLQVPPPRDVAEAIERQQKLDLLSERENATSTPTRRKFASDVASPPRMTPAKKLRLLNDEEEEESRVATEVENILSGKLLDTDISSIPEIEELMSTESKNKIVRTCLIRLG